MLLELPLSSAEEDFLLEYCRKKGEQQSSSIYFEFFVVYNLLHYRYLDSIEMSDRLVRDMPVASQIRHRTQDAFERRSLREALMSNIRKVLPGVQRVALRLTKGETRSAKPSAPSAAPPTTRIVPFSRSDVFQKATTQGRSQAGLLRALMEQTIPETPEMPRLPNDPAIRAMASSTAMLGSPQRPASPFGRPTQIGFF